jgi:glycosyltransferase involved in cell wall biosynthesis
MRVFVVYQDFSGLFRQVFARWSTCRDWRLINLEPYRGFHSFMRALAIVQRQHPTCQALIVGGDDVSYGRAPVDAPHWRAKLCQEVRLDPARTHFLGKIPYTAYRQVLQVSAAHVYLTYPFVLSWSMLEAMASGCLVIGSRTPPVEEVLRHGENGWLVDFFEPEAIAARVVEALAEPQEQLALRAQAQRDVRQRFSRRAGMAGYEELVRRVVGFPGPAVIDEVAA